MSRDLPELRLLLPRRVDLSELEDVALQLGWLPVGSRAASDDAPYVYAWQVDESTTQVQYVWDDLVQVGYLYLVGAEAVEVAFQIRARVDVDEVESVLRRLDQARTTSERLDDVLRLAAARPPLTDRAMSALLTASDDPDPWVRRAVVTAAGYLSWPALVARTRAMRSGDPDQEVRDEASIVLDAMAGLGPSSADT